MHALNRPHLTHAVTLKALLALIAIVIALALAPNMSGVGGTSTGSAGTSSTPAVATLPATLDTTAGGRGVASAGRIAATSLADAVFRPIRLPWVAVRPPWADPWSATTSG